MGKRMSQNTKSRSIWRKLNTPAGWIAVFVYVFTLTLCPLAIVSIFKNYGHNIYASIGYFICGLLFVYTVYMLGYAIVELYRHLRRTAKRKKKRIFTEPHHVHEHQHRISEFRSILFASISLFFNIGYTLFCCIMAIQLKSSWHGSLAIYYILLTLTRGGMLIQTSKDEERFEHDKIALHNAKLGTYSYSGTMMIALSLAFSVSVVQVVVGGAGFRAPVWSIYVFAAFAVCRLFVAIVNFIKSSRHDDLAARSAKYINLTTALVSLLSLQTAVLTLFPSVLKQALINGITGGLVFLLELLLGIYMVVFAIIKHKRMKKREVLMAEQEELRGYNRDGYQDEYGA